MPIRKLENRLIKSLNGTEYLVKVTKEVADAGKLKTPTGSKSYDELSVTRSASAKSAEYYLFAGKQDLNSLNKDKPVSATIPIYDKTEADKIKQAGKLTYKGVTYFGRVRVH